MAKVESSEEEQFFQDVEAAAKKAIWCALATIKDGEPRVRMIHPTWEGKTLWIATGPETPKAVQIRDNSAVDMQFQVAPEEFIHLLVRGQAEVLTDQATKDRMWDVMDYDLSQFFPDGPGSDDYCVIRVTPTRVELSEMFGMDNKRVWQG
jgi:general stress protein 26